jgi:hypothetical protein
MISKRFTSFFHYGTGLMDALTGLGLVVSPSLTLGLMGLTTPPEPVFVSYLGVFVFAVGMSHFLAGRFPNDERSRERWATTWRISALVRSCVALFVSFKLASGQLPLPWLTVAGTDATVALVLIFFLRTRVLSAS